MKNMIFFALAAAAEIAGCYAFFAWLKLGKPVLWLVPGLVVLSIFALMLALVDSPTAGRTYAAYGGIYIVASLLWLRFFEGFSPDRWDIAGATLALAGAAVIIAAPR